MGKISEQLARHTNQVGEFGDDTEIKEFLIEWGIAAPFQPKPDVGQNTIQMVASIIHPTHYIMALLFVGLDRPLDNGYVLICIPKSEASIDDFNEICNQYRNRYGQGAIKSSSFQSGPGNSSN